METFNTYFLCLLIRFAFSFSINREALTVYSIFYTQLDVHNIFNHTLRGGSEVNLRSVTNAFNKKQ